MRRLETHYRDLCDIEFTVERGKLWMLQTRVGKRTAAAAFRIAAQLVDEQLITLEASGQRIGRVELDSRRGGRRYGERDVELLRNNLEELMKASAIQLQRRSIHRN
jgi:phosphoenolpyruvate synthase/pyruvate phosphate dikinase